VTAFTPEQVDQLLRAQLKVVELLKERFPNLTVAEATKLSHEIVKLVLVEIAR